MNDEILPLALVLAQAARRRARRKRSATARKARAAPLAHQRVGDAHEDAALRLLQARGLVLLARNLACRHGEIDLAMRDGAVLVFVEVRARRDARGGAAASIGAAKQRRLAQAARTGCRAWPPATGAASRRPRASTWSPSNPALPGGCAMPSWSRAERSGAPGDRPVTTRRKAVTPGQAGVTAP